MRTDLKIGMLIGIVIVIITILIISSLPDGSVADRLNKNLKEKTANTITENPDPAEEKPIEVDDNDVDTTKENSQANKEKMQQVLDRLYSQAGQVVDDTGKSKEIDNDLQKSNEQTKSPIIRIKTYHTVLEGQTLSHISMQYYGTTSNWDIIQKANEEILPNPNLLRVGMRLAIPEE